jgi:hypothetical protein
MYVTLQLKLPADLVVQLNDRLTALLAAHEDEAKVLRARVSVSKNPGRENSQLLRMVAQTKLINIHNLTRACLLAGFEEIKITKDGRLIERMCAIGLSRGRPNGG